MSNLLVCAVILTTQVMNQRSFHYFVTSLVAADLLTSAVAQPLLVLVLADYMSFKCTLTIHYAFRSVANIASSSALLKVTFIALDRCLKVQNGFDYTDTFTLRKKIVLAFTWLHSFMFSLVRVWMDKAELTSYFIAVLFGICIACVIVCYKIIYYKVSRYLAFFNTSQPKIMRAGNSRAGEQKNDSPTEDRAQQRLLIFTLVLVPSVTTVGWLPSVYLNLTQPRKYYGLVYYVSATIVLSVSALNPFIYCLNNKEYRRTLMRIFARFLLCFQEMYRKKWKGSFYTTSSVNDTMTTVSFQAARMYVECSHWILQSSERGVILQRLHPYSRRATPFVLHCKECCVTSPRTGSRKAGFLFAVKIPLRQVLHKLLSTSPTGFLNDCFIARKRAYHIGELTRTPH
ncbi:hypothetical protein P5673_029487 [Acropora cervicornis]|uniref:G-protein coupled receptors family 1 profile domain-containing protein n=1 Tax=Acropora cervicornis TaxID=6130 RepID=A0AAD9PVX0_ACRCE|nr:hypothetical protein P5673_029487 [Acropora cervicornis]